MRTLVTVMLLIAACATAPAPSPPNGLITVAGRNLEVYCSGSGGPPVILEAGLGNTADVWSAITTRVQSFTTVCAYNRAGLGNSDPRPGPNGAALAAADLEAMLSASGLKAPYVLVGASYGGLVVQNFARQHPEETLGVVLVDALSVGWDDQLEAILSPTQVAERRAIPNIEPITNEEIRSSERDLANAPPFPAVPLVVLHHGVPFPGDPGWPTTQVEALWTNLQEGLAGLSPKSVLLLAAESGHRIHQQQPDLVTDAIRAIVDPTRWPPSAPPPPSAFGTGAPAADPSAVPGLFAFSAEDGIHVARADGSDDHLVVANDAGFVGEPSLDAAGKMLAYTAAPPGGSPQAGSGPDSPTALYVRDLGGADGVASRKLADHAQMPAVSPNAQSIAFTNAGHTYVIGADGSGLVDLGTGGCPVWSPDGTQLAMCTASDVLFVIRLSDLAHLQIHAAPGTDPTAWSPDGQTIATISVGEGNGEIDLVALDGSSERRITQAPGNQYAQAWTAAGLLVTSSSPNEEVSDWYLVDPDTGAPALIPWLHGIPNPIGYAPAG